MDSKETEDDDDDDDEDDVDETTNVRKKQSKRNPVSDHQSRAKVIARRKKRYNIQFTFDADVRCAVTIYYFCTEEITPQVSIYSDCKAPFQVLGIKRYKHSKIQYIICFIQGMYVLTSKA